MTDSQHVFDDPETVVKVMHDYTYFSKNDNKNLTFKAGEEYYLIVKTSENWWFVKRQREDTEGVYVPAQYVKEVQIKRDEGGSMGSTSPLDAKESVTILDNKLRSKPPPQKPIKHQESITSQLTDGVVQELNDILESLNVPEEYQDESQTRVTDSGNDKGDLPPITPKTEPSDHEAPEAEKKSDGQSPKEEQRRVESETSDYKTDSRESLDSEGRGFEASEDPGNTKVPRGESLEEESEYRNLTTFRKGLVEAPKKPADKMIKSDTMGDYANLVEIQKAIHGRPKLAPPLADNLLPPGYSRPYKDQQSITTAHSKTEAQTIPLSAESPTTPPVTAAPQSHPLQTPGGSPPAKDSGPEGANSPGSDGRASMLQLQPKMVDKQGPLQKSKVEENSKKMKKSWSQSYVVLSQDQLFFYKDMKSSSAKPRSISSLGKAEFVVDLKGAKITSAPEDKNVKKDAFMLITTSKVHFLLHHEDEENNDHWKRSIQNNISALQSGVVPETSGTLTLKAKPEAPSSHDVTESKQTIADKLRNFLLRRPSKEAIKKKGIYKEVTFGSSLMSICDREREKVPRFVKECILAIEARGLTLDGLYRVSGNVSSVQKLRSMVDHNEYYDLNQPSWDVHTITGALKLFFRELSEPLFTFKLFQPFLVSLNNVHAVKDLMKQLPTPHYKTMKLLFKHLNLVLQHSRENRMQVQGLAIVFGPTLMWPENASKDSNLAFSLVQQGQLVEFIINNSKALFG